MGSIPPTHIVTDSKVENDAEFELSPTTQRRNRDLARALGFGTEEEDDGILSPPSIPEVGTSSTASPTVEAILPPVLYSETEESTVSTQPEHASSVSSVSTSIQHLALVRGPGAGPLQQSELAQEVQRRAEAATLALMNTSSGRKFSDVNSSKQSVIRKKLSPSQISTPVLVSAPPSMETIPLPQVVAPPTSTHPPSLGLTQRMRRLRNTLRVKPAVSSVEEAPAHVDHQPQTISSGLTRRPTIPIPKIGPGDSADATKLKNPTSNTPASTTPGLKGLMARFRKPRVADHNGDGHSSGHSRTSPTTSSPTASSHRGTTAAISTISGTPPVTEGTARPDAVTTAPAGEVDSAAVKQLFEAASNLGLDQAALNDLLVRSTSVSRATGWGLSGGTPVETGNRSGNIMDRNDPGTSIDKVQDVLNSGASAVDDRTVRKGVMRRAMVPTQTAQMAQNAENSAVIRRTLIFPSEFKASSKVDLSQTLRKQSVKKHRRSSSGTSAQSARSVHDRAPTPPPPKSNGARRFSTDRSPPVPSMTTTSITAQAEALLRTPTTSATKEKQNSAYESL